MTIPPRRLAGISLSLIMAIGAPVLAAPADPPYLPLAIARGSGSLVAGEPIAPSLARQVDGNVSDWVGRPSRFGGTAVYSGGELVYQDHIFDAYGADDGRDAGRRSTLDPLEQAVPQSYRIEPMDQYVPGELGVPMPAQLAASMNYGNMPHQDEADLQELRVAADGSHAWILARTTTMTSASKTSLLLLFDVTAGSVRRSVPFGSGLHTDSAEIAVLVSGSTGWLADLATEAVSELAPGSVATNHADYINAIEVRLPLSTVADGSSMRIAAATGVGSGGQLTSVMPNNAIANVAFRFNEPVRGNWFEKLQAMALYNRSIDQFFYQADVLALITGVTQEFVPGPGYHDRIFTSAANISRESGQDGMTQHYGVYIPSGHMPSTPAPMQFWLHWRGGQAHTAAAVTPRIFQHLGEERDAIVVAPRGRGTSRWYVGKGHVDFQEVWADATSSFSIDRNRVYLAGHSMGGWGSYLMGVLYPDRFAAALPVAGPVTQGAWTGADFPGCDSFRSSDYSPCYVQANGGNARVQHTRRMLDNVRNVPFAIFHGAADELVPLSGVARQAEKLQELGYRYRFYTFPGYEHYSHPLADEWAEGGRYLDQFVRELNPARVTYIRDMPFERSVETVQSDGVSLNFDFDSAYWMSGLTPVDMTVGVARVDAQSHAVPETAKLVVPEAGGPASIGQTGPYVMVGERWVDNPAAPSPSVSNGFKATLTGAAAVQFDLGRMGIEVSDAVSATVITDGPLQLRLSGSWTSLPAVTVNGSPAAASLSGYVLTISLAPGSSVISII